MGSVKPNDVLHFYDHQEARSVLLLAIAALMPLLLRTVGDWFINSVVKKCKKWTAQNIIGNGKSTAYIFDMMNTTPNWKETRKSLGLNCCGSLFISAMRLIFWHWMQPMLYVFVFYAYFDVLDKWQKIFGFAVAGREAIYFLMTVICIFINPSYLLADLKASWKKKDIDDKMAVIVYALAPEKYVLMCILDADFEGCSLYCLVILSILDCFGIAAFVSAFVANNVYIPMMIGYGLTTLGAFVFVAVWIYAQYCIKAPSAPMSVDIKTIPRTESERKNYKSITKKMPTRPPPQLKKTLLSVQMQ